MRNFIFLALASMAWGQAPTGEAARGKQIFDKYGCYQCHDHDAKGGAGARLAPNPLPFGVFSRYVRKPTGDMPPYTAKVVTEQDLTDIYAFLKGIPPPPAAKSLPLLNN